MLPESNPMKYSRYLWKRRNEKMRNVDSTTCCHIGRPFVRGLGNGTDHIVEEFLHGIFVKILNASRRVAAVRADRKGCQVCAAYLLVL